MQEPLRKVINYVELLAKHYQGKLDEKADTFIAHTVDSVTRLRSLIEALLTYSHVGNTDLSLKKTNMVDLVNQVITNLEMTIQENNAKITYDTLPTVMANNLQLTQLLQNLIGNAIKFHADTAPKIHISAQQENSKWIFRVCDNGIGIEEEYPPTGFKQAV